MLYNNSRLKPSDPLKRTGKLPRQSAKGKVAEAAKRRAYAAAADAGQEFCTACGAAGPVEHSHLWSQGNYPQHRNDARNWQQLGVWCECHRLFENQKAVFATLFPDCWRAALLAMREVDAVAYAGLKYTHLIPKDLLP